MSLPILPQDVIHNILLRLPVKSLMRLRCVSKSMDSLVHDPLFVKLHLHRALGDLDRRRVLVCTDPPQYILSENLGKGHDLTITMPIEYPFEVTPDDIEIIGSCNGLLCFMVAVAYSLTDYKFILWNPSTGACRELANPGPLIGHYPDIIPIYGFGYDAESNDYKIIRAASPYNGATSTQLEIYSLKSNAWRKMQASLPCILTDNYWRLFEPCFPGLYSRGTGVQTNGAVHWLEKRTADTHETELILSFNLAKEHFEEVIPLLDNNKQDSFISELQVLGGCLSVLVHKWKTSRIELWVMKEYGIKSSWTMTATMPDNPGPLFEDSFNGDWLVPFGLCANGYLLFEMDGCEVLIYYPDRMIFSKIDLGENQNMFLVQEFVESLVSPHGSCYLK
ncbi:unnamed protein product [Rhodiola kirilowii]